MREEQNSKRARKKSRIKLPAPRELMRNGDAMCVLNGFKMVFGASPYLYAAGEWMFEHREAVPTPLGGGAIAHSLIRPAHLAPCHDIRYTL
jgi:hypothetical protein